MKQDWASGILAFGAVVAMTAVLLVFQLGQPRILMAMSRDGLLGPWFSKVHPRYRTPHVTTILTGVLVLRVREPGRPRPFRVPLVPLVPLLGIGMCLFLMAGLPRLTWERFFLWLLGGLVVYFSYGRRHSRLAKGGASRG